MRSTRRNVLFRDSITKEEMAEEMKLNFKMLNLVHLQDEHEAHVSRAAHTEVKMNMRQSVLDLSVSRQNPALVSNLKKSRLSTLTLYGPLPECSPRYGIKYNQVP